MNKEEIAIRLQNFRFTTTSGDAGGTYIRLIFPNDTSDYSVYAKNTKGGYLSVTSPTAESVFKSTGVMPNDVDSDGKPVWTGQSLHGLLKALGV